MQLSPHKIDTTLLSSFVAGNTRFNSCVYFYFYDPPIKPRRQGHQDQALIEHDLSIKLPSNLLEGRDPIGPPIDQDPDQTPGRPSDPPTDKVPRKRNQDKTNQFKLVSVKFSLSNSQSILQSPNRDHNQTPDLPIEPTIARSISLSIEIKIELPSYQDPDIPNKWISQRTRETAPSRYLSRSHD